MFSVLRFLRVKCHILHRDISKGNVLYIEDVESPATDATPESESIPREDLCFLKYLLSERYVGMHYC